MEIENKGPNTSYSIIFIGPNREIGGMNGGLGQTEQEAIEIAGQSERVYCVSRHPTEDRFIRGLHPVSVSSYAVIQGYFPQEMGLGGINEKGEIAFDGDTWKPSDVDKLILKGTLVICQ